MSEKDELKSGVSRRDFLKIAGITGATIGVAGGLGGILAACGGDEETTTTDGCGHHRHHRWHHHHGRRPARPRPPWPPASEEGREIKIGFVTPLTGGIASFGVPDKYCVDRADRGYRRRRRSAATARSTPSASSSRTASPTPPARRR